MHTRANCASIFIIININPILPVSFFIFVFIFSVCFVNFRYFSLFFIIFCVTLFHYFLCHTGERGVHKKDSSLMGMLSMTRRGRSKDPGRTRPFYTDQAQGKNDVSQAPVKRAPRGSNLFAGQKRVTDDAELMRGQQYTINTGTSPIPVACYRYLASSRHHACMQRRLGLIS